MAGKRKVGGGASFLGGVARRVNRVTSEQRSHPRHRGRPGSIRRSLRPAGPMSRAKLLRKVHVSYFKVQKEAGGNLNEQEGDEREHT